MPNQETGPVTGEMVKRAIIAADGDDFRARDMARHINAALEAAGVIVTEYDGSRWLSLDENTMLAAQGGGGYVTGKDVATVIAERGANNPHAIASWINGRFFTSTPAKPPLVFTEDDFGGRGDLLRRWEAVKYAKRRIAEYYGAGTEYLTMNHIPTAKPPLVFTEKDFSLVGYWAGRVAKDANRRVEEYYGAGNPGKYQSETVPSTVPKEDALPGASAAGESPAPSPAQPAPDLARTHDEKIYAMFRERPDDFKSSYLFNFYRRGFQNIPLPRASNSEVGAAWRAGRDNALAIPPAQPAPDLERMRQALDIIAHMPQRKNDHYFNWLIGKAMDGLGIATPPAPQPQGESVTVRKIVQLYRCAEETDSCLTDDGLVWYYDAGAWNLWSDIAPKFRPIPEPEEVAGEASGI